MVTEGDAAPDFRLKTIDGEAVALQDVVDSGRHVLLVFLRHLG
jgi:peroxiredoxin